MYGSQEGNSLEKSARSVSRLQSGRHMVRFPTKASAHTGCVPHPLFPPGFKSSSPHTCMQCRGFKTAWSYTSLPASVFVSWCVIKHRDYSASLCAVFRSCSWQQFMGTRQAHVYYGIFPIKRGLMRGHSVLLYHISAFLLLFSVFLLFLVNNSTYEELRCYTVDS
jgi:hypothetical protein